MSASLNRVILAGNLTRDPSLRATNSGASVCEFGMAISRRFKDQSGEMRDEVCFVDVTAWGRTAENVANYLRKGSPVLIEGRLQYQSWDAKDGTKRSRLIVVAEAVQFLGGRDHGGHCRPGEEVQPAPPVAPPRPPADSAATARAPVCETPMMSDGEIPF